MVSNTEHMVALNLSFRKQFLSLGGWNKSGLVDSHTELSSKGALLPPVSENWDGNREENQSYYYYGQESGLF